VAKYLINSFFCQRKDMSPYQEEDIKGYRKHFLVSTSVFIQAKISVINVFGEKFSPVSSYLWNNLFYRHYITEQSIKYI
jgi:hypothetical protein